VVEAVEEVEAVEAAEEVGSMSIKIKSYNIL
jgi:hypothetical protein